MMSKNKDTSDGKNNDALNSMAGDISKSMETGEPLNGEITENFIDFDDDIPDNVSHFQSNVKNDKEFPPLETKLKNSNIDDLVHTCSDAIETIIQYEQDRRETNSEIAAVREKLESLGISKRALAMAIAVSKMSEDQLDGFDLAYRILRKAIRQPIQDDMFL